MPSAEHGKEAIVDVSPESLQSMVTFFNGITKDTGMDRAILRAQKRGEKRSPKTHHFIMHGGFPWHPRVLESMPKGKSVMDTSRDEYGEEIERILKGEPYVALTYPDEEAHSPFQHDRNRTIATDDPKNHGGDVIGMVSADSMRELLTLIDGIHPEDHYLIHGAALDRCPTKFGIQLCGCVHPDMNVFLPPASGTMPANRPERRHLNTIMHVMYQLRLLGKNIGMGNIHNTGCVTKPDSITRDLITPETHIFTERLTYRERMFRRLQLSRKRRRKGRPLP